MRTIQQIARDIATQDNRITALPVFIVQRQRRAYGIDENWGGTPTWLNDGDEAAPAKRRYLEKRYLLGKDTKGWARTCYKDYWEFVTACFTENGCKEYLRQNGHNLGKTRIYVETGYRNDEWDLVRSFLLYHRA